MYQISSYVSIMVIGVNYWNNQLWETSVWLPGNNHMSLVVLSAVDAEDTTELYHKYKVKSSLGQNSRPVFSKRTLSLRPRRNSGIPDRKTRILMDPTISLRRTLPLALTWKAQKKQYNVMFESFLE